MLNEPDPDSCLQPGRFIDSTELVIRSTVEDLGFLDLRERERAIALFEFVRDGLEYEFAIRLQPEEYRASITFKEGRGFCVRKSLVLCALSRAAGIPSALVLSDMRDRSLSPGVTAALGTDVMYHHGLAALYVSGRWLKVDAALSPTLVARKKYIPVIFDGQSDALQQPTTLEGKPHAEYLMFHGYYQDLPYEQMMQAFQAGYRNADSQKLQALGLRNPGLPV